MHAQLFPNSKLRVFNAIKQNISKRKSSYVLSLIRDKDGAPYGVAIGLPCCVRLVWRAACASAVLVCGSSTRAIAVLVR